MNLSEYTKILESIAPSEKKLIENGFKNMYPFIINSFLLVEKTSIIDNYDDNLIFSLFRKYHVKDIQFNDFSFYPEITSKNGYFVFARSSYSDLGFKEISTQVIEFDREEWSILSYCSQNAESFLIALLSILELYSLRFQGIISPDNDDENEKYLNKSIIAAGGIKYKQFLKEIVYNTR